MTKILLKIYLITSLLLVGCAGHGSGILMQFDSNQSLEPNQLERHCDMEDSAACMLMGKPVSLPRVPVVQGVAPAGRVIFAALLPKDQKALWYFREAGALKLTPLQLYQTHSRPHSLFRVDQLHGKGLNAGVTYELIGVNELGQLLDRRFFKTTFAGNSLRFALISGTDDHSAQASLWADLSGQKPQLIIALGNNVYTNSRGPQILGSLASPSQVWDRHVETRSRLPIFKQEFLIPLFATWNDRDFGMMNGDRSYAHTDESRRTMEAFFPNIADAKSVIEGPGLSRGLKLAGQTFLLFDNRSFRSIPRAEEPSYFGRIQEDWTLSHIRGKPGHVWLLSGEKWFGKTADSFEATRTGPFLRFLAKLAQSSKSKSNQAVKIIFAGGAQSQTEIRQIPSFSTYELDAGFQTPAGPAKSTRTAITANGGYILVEVKGTEIKAEIRGPHGAIAEKNINLKSKRR